MLLRSNDYIFYPLLLIAAAAMIGGPLVLTASDRFGATEAIRETGITISGERLQQLAAGEGLGLEVLRDADNILFARVTANAERGAPHIAPSAGVFDSLRPYEIDAIAGHDVNVTFDIAAPAMAGAETVDLAFFQNGLGQSAWTQHPVIDGRASYSFSVSVPHCNPTFSFVGLWPDAAETANRVDLYAIRIQPTGPANCTDLAD